MFVLNRINEEMLSFVLLLVSIPLINGNNSATVSYAAPDVTSVEYRRTSEGSPVPTLYENYFIDFKNLRSIYMPNSYIQTIANHAFRNLTKLEKLDLSYNQITKLPISIFSDTPKLEIVMFSNNKLTVLEKHLFANLTYLRTIDFQYNNISYIEEKCFENVPSLEDINLAYNNLRTLQMNIIDDSRSLKSMALVMNPWNCDPNLCEFMHIVINRFWQEPYVPMCYYPNATAGSTWKEVIELSMPAIVTDLKENVAVNKINMQCHTCTNTTLFWRLENESISNKKFHMSNNYSTVSKFVIDTNKNFEGNYTCHVAKCTNCVDFVNIVLKPASNITRIITWTFVIITAVSVTIYFIFFYGKSRKCSGTGTLFSTCGKK